MDVRVKLESIAHPDERYSASGVPRAEVSILSASLVTALGTSFLYHIYQLLCPVQDGVEMMTKRKTYRVEPDPNPVRCEFSDIHSSPGGCE